MKILVTSGGTKIPIDTVRNITNMSRGTFGSKIAYEFLKLGHEVFFFTANGGRTPFKIELDLADGFKSNDMQTWAFKQLAAMESMKERLAYISRYKEMSYRTFEEYKDRLERIIKFDRPDVVVLAAAVSDYGVKNPVQGKVRSDEELKIELVQLPKLIGLIKEWHPTCKLVGFKLLVGSQSYKLIAAAQKSITDNKCDMVVANDLEDIKENKHRVHLVLPTGEPITYKTDPNDPNFLARMVAEHTIKL